MFRAVLAVLLLSSFSCWSQSYPARSVKIVVPFAVGGPADIYGRFIGAKLSESLGQTFVVENRPGGGSIVGTDAVVKSAADGYTLLVMSNTHTVNETLIPKKPFELMKDLAPISGINYSDLLLVVHPSVPAKDLREFIALAKSQPGKLNYASSGPGTPASATVGVSGVIAERALPELASAFTFPARACPAMVVMASNIICTWPPRIAVRAWSLPLCGTCTMSTLAMYLNSSPAMW